MNPQDAFIELLVAAMKDAAIGGHLTQLQTQLDPVGGGRLKTVRLIIVPEEMRFKAPPGTVFGEKPRDPNRN